MPCYRVWQFCVWIKFPREYYCILKSLCFRKYDPWLSTSVTWESVMKAKTHAKSEAFGSELTGYEDSPKVSVMWGLLVETSALSADKMEKETVGTSNSWYIGFWFLVFFPPVESVNFLLLCQLRSGSGQHGVTGHTQPLILCPSLPGIWLKLFHSPVW